MRRTRPEGIAARRAAFRSAACAAALTAGCVGSGKHAAAFPDTGYPYPGAALSPAGIGLPALAPDAQHQIAGGPTVGPGGTPVPGWTILPRIDVSEAFNDNIFQTTRDRQSDFTTYVTPSVVVIGDTPAIQTRIFYAPTGIVYADHSSQDLIGQNLNADATITIVPETFFVSLRGFAAIQPTFGGLPGVGGTGFGLQPGVGLNQNNGGFLTRDTANQTESFSVAPYVVHRFGTAGTLKGGVSYSYSDTSPVSGTPVFPGLGANSGTSGSLSTYNEVLQFTSGEDFGRFRDVALATGTQYEGSGVTRGAYQYIATNQLGYAITHEILVFGEVGIEDIRFNGTPETKITDAVWAVGGQWTPDPDSSVTVGYGHKYGFDSALLNASYAVTARTRVFAQYQTGLGTDLTQLQSFALNSDVDLFGNSVDPTTGAPLFLVNNTLGASGNNTLYRNKTLSGTAVMSLDRDTLSLQLLYQDRQSIASTNLSGSESSSGFSAIVGWQHQINEDLSTNAYATYGRQNGQQVVFGLGGEIEDTYSAQASVRYNFTPTLSGIAQYTFVDRISNFPGRSFTQNVFLLGLSKQF